MLPTLKADLGLLRHLESLTMTAYDTWKTVLLHDPMAVATLDVMWACHERYREAENACWKSWVKENLPDA